MIKINLCPIDELESQYWYVPDVVAAIVVAAAGWFGVQYYLGTIQDQIDDVNTQVQSLTDSTQKLTPDLERFKTLDKDVAELNIKLSALKSITVSKIAKYRPVIVLEHMQNLKPEGVWFQGLKIGVDEDTGFEIKGQAFDNILTAELMTAIRSTGSQELDESDLRTQVYFSDLALQEANVPKAGNARGFPELARYPEFVIKGHFAERTVAAKPTTGGGGDDAGGPPDDLTNGAKPPGDRPPGAPGDPPADGAPPLDAPPAADAGAAPTADQPAAKADVTEAEPEEPASTMKF